MGQPQSQERGVNGEGDEAAVPLPPTATSGWGGGDGGRAASPPLAAEATPRPTKTGLRGILDRSPRKRAEKLKQFKKARSFGGRFQRQKREGEEEAKRKAVLGEAQQQVLVYSRPLFLRSVGCGVGAGWGCLFVVGWGGGRWLQGEVGPACRSPTSPHPTPTPTPHHRGRPPRLKEQVVVRSRKRPERPIIALSSLGGR